MNMKDLLATGTIVAFVAPAGVSVAQQEHQRDQMPQHERGAPAEKIAPPGVKHPSAMPHQNGEAQNPPASRNDRLNGRVGEEPQHRGRAETTGQAPRPSERNSEQERAPNDQRLNAERNERNRPIGQAPRQDQLDHRGSERDRTTGQAPREDRTNRSFEQDRFEQERNRTDRYEEKRPTTTGQGAAGARANVDLTPEKRTRIHEMIVRERNAPRMSNVNFDVSLGARVPRSVRFAAVPQTIVEIEPAWRSFEYFMIGDEIVIVDPRSLQIVAIVDA